MRYNKLIIEGQCYIWEREKGLVPSSSNQEKAKQNQKDKNKYDVAGNEIVVEQEQQKLCWKTRQ